MGEHFLIAGGSVSSSETTPEHVIWEISKNSFIENLVLRPDRPCISSYLSFETRQERFRVRFGPNYHPGDTLSKWRHAVPNQKGGPLCWGHRYRSFILTIIMYEKKLVHGEYFTKMKYGRYYLSHFRDISRNAIPPFVFPTKTKEMWRYSKSWAAQVGLAQKLRPNGLLAETSKKS